MAPITSARGRWHRRRLRLFGIGSPKSGTHSLAAVFAEHYRSAHEPEALVLVDLLVAVAEGRSGEDDLRRYLRSRERRLRLEVNCAGLNGLVVDQLVEVVPTARFVLTLRDPYDWLASIIDHSLRGDPAPGYRRLRHLRYQGDRVHPREEKVLADNGLFTLHGYLHSWAERNERALAVVPADQLLVVRTDQLGERLGDLADFAGVSLESLDATRTHEYAAPERSGLLDQLDPAYVRQQVLAHGTSLVERYFPERLSD
jgi:Sulfotransferase domain